MRTYLPIDRDIDATIRVTEASSVAGSQSALAVVLPRKCEPRNPEPEQEPRRSLASFAR